MVARWYYIRWPETIAGMLLIDSSHEDQARRLRAADCGTARRTTCATQRRCKHLPALALDTIADVSPSTTVGWLKVSDVHADAAGTLQGAGRNHIALYLTGYYVECSAKAVCVARHRRPPASAGAGHHLVSLLEMGGTRLSDLRPEWRRFVERRRVDLRYEEEIPPDVDGPDMYQAGHFLGSHLQRLARRHARRSRR